MSIASELVSTEENIVKAYDSLNKLGETATDKNIQNISELVDNIYAKFPKTSYQEGTEVNLGKTSKGKLDYENGVVGIGQAEQDSTQGYNLSNFNTDSQNGISYNINTIKIVNPTSFNYADNWNLKNDSSLSGSTYSIYMCVNGTKASGVTIELNIGKTGNGYAFQKLLSSNTTNFNNDISVGTITLGANEVFTSFNTYLSQSVTANLEVKVMVVKGSYTAQTIPAFEPYTGGQASPNPDYPQEIKYVRGRNKWGGFEYTRTFQNITLTFKYNNDGTFIVNGSNTSGSKQNSMPANIVLANNYYKKLSRGTYTIQGGTSNITLQAISITDNSEVPILASSFNGESASFTLNETTKVYLRVQVATGTSFNNEKVYAMLEEGSTSTPYLPYNTIEEVVSGINKLSSANAETKTNSDFSVTCDGEGIYTINSIPASSYRDVTFTLKENYTIQNGDYLQINNDFRDYRANIILKDTNSTAITSSITYNADNRIVDLSSYANQTIKYISIGFSNTAEVKGSIKPLICNSSTQVPFEPYITPTFYQLSLGEYEFNAIGNYKDELIYDVENDRVYKNEKIGKVVLNGSEDWVSFAYGTNSWRLSNVISTNFNANEVLIMSRKFKGIPQANRDDNYAQIYFEISGTMFTIRNTTYTTKAEVQSGMNGEPLYYVLATPTETELTDTTLINQVKALYNAHSNNGTTIITSNGDLPMIIKVRGLKGE